MARYHDASSSNVGMHLPQLTPLSFAYTYSRQDPFENLDFDSALMTPREPMHLLFYGWVKSYVNSTVARHLTVEGREILRTRLKYARYPSGATKITFALDSKAGKSWSMGLYATLLFLLPSLLKGLVNDDVMLGWLMFADFCCSALQVRISEPEILHLETSARYVCFYVYNRSTLRPIQRGSCKCTQSDHSAIRQDISSPGEVQDEFEAPNFSRPVRICGQGCSAMGQPSKPCGRSG